jgi:hypothetical protein
MIVDGHQQQTKTMEGRHFIITINNKYMGERKMKSKK